MLIELPAGRQAHEWIAPLALAEMGTVRFGVFSLDAATRQLLRDGRELSLSPKAFQLLSLLVVNRARAVSREELHQALWPSTFVLDTNIASLVAEVRRALDDDAAKPRFIRTMHRFGYRFVAQVDEPPMTAVQTPSAAYWLVWDVRHVPLAEGSHIIGREADASVWIDAPGVSRHHARILIDGGDATLEDLGSKNGTYVAGERVTNPRRLRDGDQIRVGSVVVTFQIPRVSVATETVS
jgi:DNA-binding winged helix-turn-helix (wHTH) protein